MAALCGQHGPSCWPGEQRGDTGTPAQGQAPQASWAPSGVLLAAAGLGRQDGHGTRVGSVPSASCDGDTDMPRAPTQPRRAGGMGTAPLSASGHSKGDKQPVAPSTRAPCLRCGCPHAPSCKSILWGGHGQGRVAPRCSSGSSMSSDAAACGAGLELGGAGSDLPVSRCEPLPHPRGATSTVSHGTAGGGPPVKEMPRPCLQRSITTRPGSPARRQQASRGSGAGSPPRDPPPQSCRSGQGLTPWRGRRGSSSGAAGRFAAEPERRWAASSPRLCGGLP